MSTYDKTTLWQQALATKVDDPNLKERERLRVAYENVRARAKPIAESIAKSLPDYTVHDITHSDALWEYADLIVGSKYPLNPAEAFVLGCSFLMHDLGMGLATYPEGLIGLKKLDLWKDVVSDLLRKNGVEVINALAIEQVDATIEKRAIAEALRRLHSALADKLALINWKSSTGKEVFYLIEDQELRDAFGPIIGRISASHCWDVELIAKEFSTVMGAQPGFPADWTVDPLKLASILRCADYSHIDERRAPAFLHALRKPEGESDDHWVFQSKLYQPRIEGDRLIFTAKSEFTINEAPAWWICFDTLNAIDSELRKVDSLLADTHRARFAARGVSQAEEPSRIAKLIRTDGWQPVDTRIRVSAVAELVGKLGGKDLYGNTVLPPLREMIQNAADAVRARRIIDNQPAEWGEIRVTSGKDEFGVWIQVEDTGVGMAEAVITGPLLDFGTSFWGSSLMHDQLPGLAARGFQATGRYGIGFFSIFMWGERVEVATQRFDRGRKDTLVLFFRKGLNERPLLRQAQSGEYVPDGGTRVKVWLSNEKTMKLLTSTSEDDKQLTLSQVCAQIAPCLDVTLKAQGKNGILEAAVTANDWLTIKDAELLKRIMPTNFPTHLKAKNSKSKSLPPLQILKTNTGLPVGRVAIPVLNDRYFFDEPGSVTVGGLHACRMTGIIGVFMGAPQRATRDSALPVIQIPLLKKWAAAERDTRLSEKHLQRELVEFTNIICALNVDPCGLPIANSNVGWRTIKQITEIVKTLDEVYLVHDLSVESAGGKIATIKLNKGVFALSMGMRVILQSEGHDSYDWPSSAKDPKDRHLNYYSKSVYGVILRAIAQGWNCSFEDVIKHNKLESKSNKERVKKLIGTLAGKPYREDVHIILRPRPKKGS